MLTWLCKLELLKVVHASILTVAIAAFSDGDAVADNIPHCPAELNQATRLIVSVADTMQANNGFMRLFGRSDTVSQWNAVGAPFPAAFGRNGLGWAFDQRELFDQDGLTKVEGDKRTPAGVFSLGSPFGFQEADLDDYLTIVPGTICVDDTKSPEYNTILHDHSGARDMSHEKMWEVSLYRHGIVINNKTSRGKRGGSCIFLHVWRSPNRPTVGCVAADASDVRTIQRFTNKSPSSFAILPKSSLGILCECGIPICG